MKFYLYFIKIKLNYKINQEQHFASYKNILDCLLVVITQKPLVTVNKNYINTKKK